MIQAQNSIECTSFPPTTGAHLQIPPTNGQSFINLHVLNLADQVKAKLFYYSILLFHLK